MEKYSRRKFISNSLKVTAGLAVVSMVPIGVNKFFNQDSAGNGNAWKSLVDSNQTPLPIPPLLENKSSMPTVAEFHLNVQMSKKEFIKGKETNTLGYNGDYLGPVIRVRNGEKVSIKVKNNLNEETTVHWHGLEINFLLLYFSIPVVPPLQMPEKRLIMI